MLYYHQKQLTALVLLFSQIIMGCDAFELPRQKQEYMQQVRHRHVIQKVSQEVVDIEAKFLVIKDQWQRALESRLAEERSYAIKILTEQHELLMEKFDVLDNLPGVDQSVRNQRKETVDKVLDIQNQILEFIKEIRSSNSFSSGFSAAFYHVGSMVQRLSAFLPSFSFPFTTSVKPPISSKNELKRPVEVIIEPLDEFFAPGRKTRRRTGIYEQRKKEDLGLFQMLPKEVLKIIVGYMGPAGMDNLRIFNRSFYENMTGYRRPGLCGIQHKPQLDSICTKRIANKVFDFNQFEKKDLNDWFATIPSFYFYTLIGEMRHIPFDFLKRIQIEDTYIHTISFNQADLNAHPVVAAAYINNLWDKRIGHLDLSRSIASMETVIVFAKNLKNQVIDIEQLDLRAHQINLEDATKLASILGNKKIHTLDLSGTRGTELLLKNLSLQNTQVHTLILKNCSPFINQFNEILKNLNVQEIIMSWLLKDRAQQPTSYVAGWIAKNLQGTNVRTVNLDGNDLCPSNIVEFVENLEHTQVSTIYLRYNRLSDLGAQLFAENLSGMKVHTIHLEGNGIGGEGAKQLGLHLYNRIDIANIYLAAGIRAYNNNDSPYKGWEQNTVDISKQDEIKRAYPKINWVF